MLLDWLAREGGMVFSWWALVTLAGAAALPIVMRLLGGLPDRGYTLARALGVLLVGFVYWLLASLGFLANTPQNIALAWAIVVIAGLGVHFSGARVNWRSWWRENRPVVIASEILFAALFIAWAVVRAHQHNISATEKPMELAFMSAVIRSEAFPPNDPWLAGYAISYYYFGYVIAAMLAMMSSIPSTTAFNLMIALLFALTGSTVFGVGYNLVRARARRDADDPGLEPPSDALIKRESGEMLIAQALPRRRTAIGVGLLAALFVILLGNYQVPLIEIPYETRTASAEYLQFWDSNERQTPRPDVILEEGETDTSAEPANWDFWWWFRGARVLNDRNLDGAREEVIDEFPQFSFLLADNHPHVLALPFAAMALGLALNVLLSAPRPDRAQMALYGLVIGGLLFLNTWDGPVYLLILLGADALRRMRFNGAGGAWHLARRDWIEMIGIGAILLAIAFGAYLPFWLAFRSQLSGVLPNLLYPTLFQQYFAHFGPFLLILIPFLLVEVWRAGRARNWRLGIGGGLAITGALLGVMILLTLAGSLIPYVRETVLGYVEANGGWDVVLPQLISKRISHGLTAIVLTLGVILIIIRLFPRDGADGETPREARTLRAYTPSTGFVLLIVAAGILLTLAPEFVYLRDNFSHRMNTVFKLYYQAWLLFGIAAAYAVYSMLADATREARPSLPVRAALAIVCVTAITLGMIYPVLGIYNRMFIETGRATAFTPAPLALDGGATLTFADDYAAAMCLGVLVVGDDVVVAEAPGGSYNGQFGRTGTLTGIPVVFNWGGHQAQWRGTSFSQAVGTRESDLRLLYQDPTWNITRQIIERYGIDYVAFGQAERQAYQDVINETKFTDRFETVCEVGGTRYYRVDADRLE